MQELTLYVDSRFTSPWALSAFQALTEKKLPFTLHTVNLDQGEQKQAAFRDLSPIGRVPLLVQGDLALAESSAIVEYLEEAFPPPAYAAVLPDGVQQRAMARQVMAWLRSDLMALRAERSTEVVFYAPVSTPLTQAGQSAAARLIAIADQLVTGEHLFGQWCIADTELALALNRLILNGDPVPERLTAWCAAQWQRDSVRQWIAKSRGGVPG
ncbi:glutathione transferase [Massilia sp. CCM 8734]|uniref:glutathione transferase n=1 Tax=Massilia sp. CCM 8734 TaxID=2609283 RepID=UPI00141DE1F4|nr:glutathione transferase [Massilia sp. CCM 8734]NHZ96752.1 glutathione transferase [Massilia sp. CCM 8734]